MKKMLKKSLALVLALVCVMNIASVIASAAKLVANGLYDENENGDIKWTLDDSGTLTINGKGEMKDMYNYYPWIGEYDKDIKKIVIEKGITRIGNNAFSGVLEYSVEYDYTWRCENLEEVEIPDGVVSIGKKAFGYALNLKRVIIPDSVEEIGDGAFGKCDNLEEVYYTGTLAQWNKIKIDDGNEALAKATVYFKGDISKDGKINSSDALMALQHSVGKIKLKSEQIVLADVHADSKINSSDALEILKISVGSTK